MQIHVNMFEVWKFNVKKNRSPTTFAGLIWGPWRHPVAREQLWSGRRATRWHRGAALVVVWFVHAANGSGRGGDGGGLFVGEEFLLGSWGLETNHACNNFQQISLITSSRGIIFQQIPWPTSSRGNRVTCLCGYLEISSNIRKFPAAKLGCERWFNSAFSPQQLGASLPRTSNQIGLQ